MKAFVCEMCGSNDLVKKDGFFVCQYCGVKYSLEEAKNLMIEVTGKVKIDNSDELNNLYIVARRARQDNNYVAAQKFYDQIVVKDPNSWEANFYSVYFQCCNCKIGEIYSSANTMFMTINSIYLLIDTYVKDETERKQALFDVIQSLMDLSFLLVNSYMNFFDNLSVRDYKSSDDLVSTCFACSGILFYAGDDLINVFGDDFSSFAVASWESAIDLDRTLLQKYYFIDINIVKQVADKYFRKIVKYNPDFKLEKYEYGNTAKTLRFVDGVSTVKDIFDTFRSIKHMF